MRLSPGDTAPAWSAPDADEKTHSLKDFKGKSLIMYFYPAALTPGCTKQACDFRDNLKLLAGSDYAVVGISPDKPAKLAKFRETHDLPFPLLSDPDKKILEAYGAWGEKTMYGKKVIGVIRSTVVVDAKGKVAHAWYNVKATGHVAKLLRDLDLASA
jgi:peroxiredoxin Q/BCP